MTSMCWRTAALDNMVHILSWLELQLAVARCYTGGMGRAMLRDCPACPHLELQQSVAAWLLSNALPLAGCWADISVTNKQKTCALFSQSPSSSTEMPSVLTEILLYNRLKWHHTIFSSIVNVKAFQWFI